MVIRLGVARVDEGEVIDVLRDMGEDLRDPGARLAVLLPLERRLHERTDLVGEEAGVFVEALEFLAIAFGQLRLVVPGIDVTGPAINEQPDDGAGLAGEMAGSRGQRMQSAAVGCWAGG